MAAQQVESGYEQLAQGNYAGAELAFSSVIQQRIQNPGRYLDFNLYNARHGLAKSFVLQNKFLPDACKLCESVVAKPVSGDRDRHLILDAAYTLAYAFLATEVFAKAKALCQLLIDGNRKFPERVWHLHESMALMAKILEANGDRKNAKVYQKLVPAGFETDYFPTLRSETSNALPQSGPSVQSIPTAERIDTPSLAALLSLDLADAAMNLNPESRTSYYDPNMSQAYDPSLTRVLLRPFQRTTSINPDDDINYITDFRNPSNPLSPNYTAFVTVPIPIKVFNTPIGLASSSESTYELLHPDRALSAPSSRFARGAKSAGKAVRSLGSAGRQERYRFVKMSRDEYVKYWIRDSNGNYLGTEPEGSGVTG